MKKKKKKKIECFSLFSWIKTKSGQILLLKGIGYDDVTYKWESIFYDDMKYLRTDC